MINLKKLSDFKSYYFDVSDIENLNISEKHKIRIAELCTNVHGSGIDGKYYFRQLKNGKIIITSYFHTMNEAGYYEGYCYFDLKFNFDFTDFKLSFAADNRTKYLVNKHYLREYLNDLYDYELSILQ